MKRLQRLLDILMEVFWRLNLSYWVHVFKIKPEDSVTHRQKADKKQKRIHYFTVSPLTHHYWNTLIWSVEKHCQEESYQKADLTHDVAALPLNWISQYGYKFCSWSNQVDEVNGHEFGFSILPAVVEFTPGMVVPGHNGWTSFTYRQSWQNC